MRKVYFSFHYNRDYWRVSQVRNSWLIRPENKTQPFLDKADWERVKRAGDQNIQRWIAGQLHGTSVTVVLIGAETSLREWVLYEIQESYKRGNGMLGIYIHNILNQYRLSDTRGGNPFDNVWINNPSGTKTHFSSLYPTYDWVMENGRLNMESWIEEAAIKVGKIS